MHHRLKDGSGERPRLIRACEIFSLLASGVYIGYLEVLRYCQIVVQEASDHAVYSGSDLTVSHMGNHVPGLDYVADLAA